MCHRVICPDCGKFTWEGCGLHIPQALAGLTPQQICACQEKQDPSGASLPQIKLRPKPTDPNLIKESNQNSLHKLLQGLADASNEQDSNITQ